MTAALGWADAARERADSDFVVPEGLVDVERRSNCSLDAIIAVLSQSPTFRRELGDGAGPPRPSRTQPRRRVPRERRGLDGRRRGGRRFACGVSQAEQRRGRRGRPERAGAGGAHLDVAEVLGEVVAVLGSAKRCRSAALALRTRGHIHQQRPGSRGHRNADFRDDVAFDELARMAPAAALVHAARSDGGSVADVFREAHAHAGNRATGAGRRGRAKSTWSSSTRPRPSC